MSLIDWLILVIPVAFVMFMGFYSRRYIRGVTDYLAAGRVCGRYVLSMGELANGLSIIGLLTYVEMQYKSGFSLSFWSKAILPISIVLSLLGYCTYRFRETRAMSIGQFLEMRYSRKLRIFAASLRSLAEMLANMIMPALAARFFIQILGLPQYIQLFGMRIETFPILIVFFVTLAATLICCGGTLALVITDTIQGMFLYPILVIFVLFVLCKFNWFNEIIPVMQDRVAGESFLNPYDIYKMQDFNVFSAVIVVVFYTFLYAANWIGAGVSSAAKSPHEQKMARVLMGWRGTLIIVFYLLISCMLITFLNHQKYAKEANQVRQSLARKVIAEVLPDDTATQQAVNSATDAVPPQVHVIGFDKPLSQKQNLDTEFLDVMHEALKTNARMKTEASFDGQTLTDTQKRNALIDAEGKANHIFQQCRTLFNQLMLSATMRKILPIGLFGLFCLLCFLAMLSTDDTRMYSSALTIAQDIILPLRKKPFTPEQHIWMIRFVTIGVAVFYAVGSYFMSQLDYIQMFVYLTCAMWEAGCGPIMIFGLYSRFGNTAGAWTSLLVGMTFSWIYVFIQRCWANVVYPFLERMQWVDDCDKILRTLSRPFGSYITWQMNPVKCPINSIEFSFFLSLFTLILYIVVSYLTKKEDFNLERMLHRGKYAVPGEEKKAISFHWSFRNVFGHMIGITPEYTRGDKIIAIGIFIYNFIFYFCLFFLATVLWNIVAPWKIQYWSIYFFITQLLLPGIIAIITTFWFGICGTRDLFRMFRDLNHRKKNDVLDDGRVEGNISLVDAEAFKKSDEKE